MFLPRIISPYNIQVFSAAKIACKPKAEQNQVREVRLIPGLNLVRFLEYGPLSSSSQLSHSLVC